jgi:putative transposase
MLKVGNVRSMPRPPRLDLAGLPQHVVQRGVDRRPCFVLEIHYREYLRYLLELADQFNCQVHAYALMCNHVHLLATPADTGGIGRMMQAVGRRYVSFFNFSMERTGTLWEGRYKSCLVDNDRYVLRCYRYIELNPVRAGICPNPAGFRWSSFRCNGLGDVDPLISAHAAYVDLGSSWDERRTAYRQWVCSGCERQEVDEIRAMTSRHRAFGSKEFKQNLESQYGRAMGAVKRGRPRLDAETE